MAQRENILDGLAWAGLSEAVRVARISAGLVRSLPTYILDHTKSAVKEAVRLTSPPYGRGKAITEAVTLEYKRQLPIYRARKEAKDDWERYLTRQAKVETRTNNAYAHAFGRPSHLAEQDNPLPWAHSTWETRKAWSEKEEARDKGDNCIELTHFRGAVVALVHDDDSWRDPHIATRNKDGKIVRTHLRLPRYEDPPKTLVAAALLLGGPKVRSALALGKRVITDWEGRRTLIHHTDHAYQSDRVEELPWYVRIPAEDLDAVVRGEDVLHSEKTDKSY